MPDNDDHPNIGISASAAMAILLDNLLKSNQRILENMVTKTDMELFRRDISTATDSLERRVSALERSKLPVWFWPMVASFAGATGSVLGWLAQHAH